MRLFLIRHGETVDNVAQLYAGVRDSALTNHGVEQAHRLGNFLSTTSSIFTHIFSSDLQRAFRTAEAIRLAQPALDIFSTSPLTTVQLPVLREQDFGFYEGKSFFARSQDSTKTGKEAHHDEHKNDSGFKDMESKESMGKRMDEFLDEHLLPLLQMDSATADAVVAVVSHGIILSTLWKRLLLRLTPNSVSFSPELLESSGRLVLKHLGGWSNTGYLELEMRKLDCRLLETDNHEHHRHHSALLSEPLRAALFESAIDGSAKSRIQNNVVKSKPSPLSPLAVGGDSVSVEYDSIIYVNKDAAEVRPHYKPASSVVLSKSASADSSTDTQPPIVPTPRPPKAPSMLANWATTIRLINGKQHLKGLKRTGGGVGSSQYDETQKTIERFFKKQKAG